MSIAEVRSTHPTTKALERVLSNFCFKEPVDISV
jgi:hypothetical protein